MSAPAVAVPGAIVDAIEDYDGAVGLYWSAIGADADADYNALREGVTEDRAALLAAIATALAEARAAGRAEGLAVTAAGPVPIVCLCGSTRFSEAFQSANLQETLAGRIVLSIGCDMRSDAAVFGAMTDAERDDTKAALDALHFRKIELADEVLILNVGGYIGESTARELAYARELGKRVRFLEGDAE